MKFIKLFESYFEDLSDYIYSMPKELGIKNIGWLDKNHDFKRGHVDEDIIEKLETTKPYIRSMGFHNCEFCGGDIKSPHSSTEIWIVSKEGQIYACPGMIIHYIKDHNYLPPQEFLEAVKTGYSFRDPMAKELTKGLTSKFLEIIKRKR